MASCPVLSLACNVSFITIFSLFSLDSPFFPAPPSRPFPLLTNPFLVSQFWPSSPQSSSLPGVLPSLLLLIPLFLSSSVLTYEPFSRLPVLSLFTSIFIISRCFTSSLPPHFSPLFLLCPKFSFSLSPLFSHSVIPVQQLVLISVAYNLDEARFQAWY